MKAELQKKLLLDTLAVIKQRGFKTYTCRSWAYFVDKNDTVFYMEVSNIGRISFTLCYAPSRNCGTGCSAGKDFEYVPTFSEILECMQAGYRFQIKLGAAPIKSGEYFKNHWFLKDVKEF